MEEALKGIKVLDLSRVLAGPFTTMILADMGAEVIKIEIPNRGDDSRAFGPYVNGESAYFMSVNRNKSSMTLNLKSEKSKEIFLKLVEKADIVVENYRPGTMEKLGLGYETLKKVNPRIIYSATSGFGHTGPYSKRPAYDAVVQAMGGIMSITGKDENNKTKVGSSIGDIVAGLYSTIGILSALEYRNRTGRGQKVDVAMLDSQVAILENAIARYGATGQVPKPIGNRHPSIIPFEDFPTKDGSIIVAAGNDNLFHELCRALGLEELIDDERFISNSLRGENYQDLRRALEIPFRSRTTEEWIEIFNERGIPNGPINDIEDLINDPQVQAREMIVKIDHKLAGETLVPGLPIKLSESPGRIKSAAPILGEDTARILREVLGFSDEEVDRLRKDGSI